MTPEQLEEIEKLARDPKSAAFHDLMARQTIPLVKALREALAEVEREKASATRGWQAADELHLTVRDLKAEVERLRTAIGNALTNGHMNALCWATNDGECVGRCRLLRDALNKEITKGDE